jgi:hypothetical protein
VSTLDAIELPLDAGDADSSNSCDDTDAVSLQIIFEEAPLSPINHANDSDNNTPSTPHSRPDPVIDPMLRNTPELDSSALTETPSPILQTPDVSGPSTQRNSSPLSSVPDVLTPATTTQEIPSLKRKRQVLKTDRPKARMTSKARRKAAQA